MFDNKDKIFWWRIVFALFMILFPVGSCLAQTAVDSEKKVEIVDSISSGWDDWSEVSISGKLKMDGLPLSPSVKIFMERDSSVVISLRAPLMGEVGRAEIYSDTLLVVNKMKKTYVKESLEQAFAYYPGTLSDVQNLLLGRVVIPGEGLLGREIASSIELFPEEDDKYSLIPGEGHELDGFNYGYLIDGSARPEILLVIPTSNPDINVSLTYDYFPKGYDLTVLYQTSDKSHGGTLELDAPVWGGNPIDPIKLNNRYTRLNISDFIKSF